MRTLLSSLTRYGRAALLLVAAACASPGRADAGCGDYVTILNGPAGSAHHPMPDADHPAAPANAPCHGPNCSGAPARDNPPLAPVTPVGPQGKELAHSIGLVNVAGAQRPAFDRDLTSPRPVRRASSVFHPPRVG